MLKKLLNRLPALTDSDASARLAAIESLNVDTTAQYADELAGLARRDPDLRVRLAAVKHVTDPHQLTPLLEDSNREIAQQAATRLADRLLQTDSVSLPQDPHPLLQQALLIQAPDLAPVAGLMGSSLKIESLQHIALKARSPEVRLAAAERILPEADLSRLEKASRNRDKRINRYCRERLEQCRRTRASVQEGLDQLDQLTAKAQQLTSEVSGIHRQQRLIALEQSATAVIESLESNLSTSRELADSELADTARTRTAALKQALMTTAKHIARTPASDRKAVHPQSSSEPGQEDPGRAFEALRMAMGTLEQSAREQLQAEAPFDATRLKSTRSKLEQRWFSLAETTPHEPALFDDFQASVHRLLLLEQACQRLDDIVAHIEIPSDLKDAPATDPVSVLVERMATREWRSLWTRRTQARSALKQIDRGWAKLKWPEGYPLPYQARQLEAQRALCTEFVEKASLIADQLTGYLKTLLEELEQNIEQGHPKPASDLNERFRNCLAFLPPGSDKPFQAPHRRATIALRELKDWQTYATNPKREALCQEMEALPEQGLTPADQGARIKELRRRWQKLGPISSRTDYRLLQRFNTSAERAFEPCRAYYQEQAELRKFNLEQRSKICQELSHYLEHNDWQHTNWKAAQQILFSSREEWRRFHPVERGPGRKLQDRFQQLTDALHEKINTQWQHNLDQKSRIVSQAEAVLGSESDSREKIDQIKSLQKAWAQVGITPRGPDQKLWKQFRKHCDAVFAARDDDRLRAQQARSERLGQLQSLCQQFARTVSKTSADEAQPEVLNDFRQRFNALYEASSARGETSQERKLKQHSVSLCNQYQQLLSQARHAKKQVHLRSLLALDEALSDLETRCLNSRECSPGDLKDLLPETPPPVLTERLNRLETGIETGPLSPEHRTDLRVDSQALSRLTIRAELAAGLESPEDERKLRLELQVERLNQGFKHSGSVSDDPLDLVNEWLAGSKGVKTESDTPSETSDLPTGVWEGSREVAELRARFMAACMVLLG